MDKNTLLAFLLIAMVLLGTPYYYEVAGISKRPNKAVNSPLSSEKDSLKILETPVKNSLEADYQKSKEKSRLSGKDSFGIKTSEETRVTVKTPLYQTTISSLGGGTLTSFQLNHYQSYQGGPVNLIGSLESEEEGNSLKPDNLIISFKNLAGDTVTLNHSWQLISPPISKDTLLSVQEPVTLIFQAFINNLPVTKSLTFLPDSYLVNIQVDLSQSSAELISQEQFQLSWEGGLPLTEKNSKDDMTYSSTYLYQGGELIKHNGKSGRALGGPGQTEWTAIRTKYFVSAFIPNSKSAGGEVRLSQEGNHHPLTAHRYEMQITFPSMEPISCGLYLGPLQYHQIKSLGVNLDRVMNFGWPIIRPISKGVWYLLTSLYSVIPNYGVLLIMFSFLVKIVLYPLTKKSHQSTREMQALQPLIARLREKHKNNLQKIQQESMKLYKEHGVNPLGGCLPALLQMPFFFAVFIVFRSTIELRGQPFVGWIHDLSAPDTIFELPFQIPLYGDQVSLLPIFMAISMWLQQKLMSTQATGQQKLMITFMTVSFFLVSNNFPSGLNLYYTFFNLLTVIQQQYFTKKLLKENSASQGLSAAPPSGQRSLPNPFSKGGFKKKKGKHASA